MKRIRRSMAIAALGRGEAVVVDGRALAIDENVPDGWRVLVDLCVPSASYFGCDPFGDPLCSASTPVTHVSWGAVRNHYGSDQDDAKTRRPRWA